YVCLPVTIIVCGYRNVLRQTSPSRRCHSSIGRAQNKPHTITVHRYVTLPVPVKINSRLILKRVERRVRLNESKPAVVIETWRAHIDRRIFKGFVYLSWHQGWFVLPKKRCHARRMGRRGGCAEEIREPRHRRGNAIGSYYFRFISARVGRSEPVASQVK